jgi:hypothetical protein
LVLVDSEFLSIRDATSFSSSLTRPISSSFNLKYRTYSVDVDSGVSIVCKNMAT